MELISFHLTLKIMGNVFVGTVDYHYRDWMGLFYPQGSSLRRQLSIYSQNFNICELTQFANQIPQIETIERLASQIPKGMRVFLRLHNSLTMHTDIELAATVARHFRKVVEPLVQEKKFGGFIGCFPYAFRNTLHNRDYIYAIDSYLKVDDIPLQLDLKHSSWLESIDWLKEKSLGFVSTDEPDLPGLRNVSVPATSRILFVRLHGRNEQSWWSGNVTTRHDYLYPMNELTDLLEKYESFIQDHEVHFIFQNTWQAQGVKNALQLKVMHYQKMGFYRE